MSSYFWRPFTVFTRTKLTVAALFLKVFSYISTVHLNILVLLQEMCHLRTLFRLFWSYLFFSHFQIFLILLLSLTWWRNIFQDKLRSSRFFHHPRPGFLPKLFLTMMSGNPEETDWSFPLYSHAALVERRQDAPLVQSRVPEAAQEEERETDDKSSAGR